MRSGHGSGTEGEEDRAAATTAHEKKKKKKRIRKDAFACFFEGAYRIICK